MSDKIIPTQNDINVARDGVKLQYDAMFDEDTRAKMAELGVDKFIDYVVYRLANQDARIRFYANCLHPK